MMWRYWSLLLVVWLAAASPGPSLADRPEQSLAESDPINAVETPAALSHAAASGTIIPDTPGPNLPSRNAPSPITTDTTEYCQELAQHMANLPDAPKEARELSAEGAHLCSEGHVRGGIAHLRRAIMISRQAAK